MNVDERIRRAEELYNRRKMQGGVRVSTSNVNNSSRSGIRLFKKMIIKIIICAIVYFIFYILKNSGMFFSKDVISQTQKIMSYDINFNQAYSKVIELYNERMIAKTKENLNEEVIEPESTPNVGNDVQQNSELDGGVKENLEVDREVQQTSELGTDGQQTSELNSQILDNLEIEQEELGIGGAETDEEPINIVESTPIQETVIQKTQMEIDAEYIKSNFSFKKPAQGIITSRFGPREPTEIISANHKGIDIGANTGTPIYAAMEGTVTNISNYGDYGKHFYIKNGDVITLYAHCSKINVDSGQFVTQGQKIAEIGSTGRTTGPHLHFEIRIEDRIINPEYVLDF